VIGLISATAAGAAARDRLAAAWPDRTRVYEGPVPDAVRSAFAECEQLVCFLATGAVVRLVAPLLAGKTSDPGVVCVDEGGRFAVSLLGGHGGGANDLAREVAGLLDAEPVVTTATDAVGLPGLDTLGLPVEGDVAAVSRALLDGEAVALRAEVAWPLPPLPVADEGRYTIRVTDRLVEPAEREVLLRPPTPPRRRCSRSSRTRCGRPGWRRRPSPNWRPWTPRPRSPASWRRPGGSACRW
jgi:cobalt-precorrin 5A hydrolase/precorrin-3B C17-methyltransferase